MTTQLTVGDRIILKHVSPRGFHRVRCYGHDWEIVEDLGEKVRVKPSGQNGSYITRTIDREGDPDVEIVRYSDEEMRRLE